jgi:hypothetical protein
MEYMIRTTSRIYIGGPGTTTCIKAARRFHSPVEAAFFLNRGTLVGSWSIVDSANQVIQRVEIGKPIPIVDLTQKH